MELLLNFLWLTVALAALLVCQRQSGFWRSAGKRCHSRSFVLLGCLLALLFPVVSASDDLHPISAEIEESAPFKRTVKQSTGIKAPASICHGGVAALPTEAASLRPENETFKAFVGSVLLPPRQPVANIVDNRAPPSA